MISSPTMLEARDASAPGADVLTRLRGVCERNGLDDLGAKLDDLAGLLTADIRAVDAEIASLPTDADVVRRSAGHLLARGGKRLRPMIVAATARLGAGFSDAVRDVAVAVELVHSATLLHDDVVDAGDLRRGAPTARALYGNAASIFAGDYLLVEALRRVVAVGCPDVLTSLLEQIDAMVTSEAMQLESRGRFEASLDRYFRVVDGKTAALFQWAVFAGARAAGLDVQPSRELSAYGREVGIAFQLVDDALDYDGDADSLGKEPFADLREGKSTYPVLIAVSRSEVARRLVERIATEPGALEDSGAREALAAAIRSTGALAETRRRAAEHVERALSALRGYDDRPAKRALEVVARAVVLRDH